MGCLVAVSLFFYAGHALAADPRNALSPSSEPVDENDLQEPLTGEFSSGILKNSPYSTSFDVMGMFLSQTGSYQIGSQLGITHRDERFALSMKGSFQEISSDTKTSQSADGRAKLDIPLSTFYGYFLTGAQWRSDRTDFYYTVAGPGMELVKGMRGEIGAGVAFADPGGSVPLGRAAIDFEYDITDGWVFGEQFAAFVLSRGPVQYIFDSDTTLRYRLTSQAAFKTSLSYTAIDDSWRRVQLFVGLSYKL